jgi:GNAT superfamily N-acetyltransferase
MRAKDFITEKVNPKMANRDFHAEKDIDITDVGTLKLVAQGMDTDYPHQFTVNVINQAGKKVGHFRFVMMKYNPEKRNMFGFKVANKEDPYVIGGNVSVWDEYQKKGIATQVYKFVKELGNDIRPSTTQSPAGKAMWKSFDREHDVTEDSFGGIDIDMDIEGDEIMVTAMANGRELGHVLFVDEGEYLMPQDLEVDERFQGQGIAAAMYDYVKSKGYKIRRSGQQTDAGAGFWGKHRPEQNVWEDAKSSDRIIFIGNDTAIVGQEHGKRLQLSDSDAERVQDIAQRHGAWYEGNGMDRKLTAGIIDDYKGSWDDDLLSPAIEGYPAPFLYVLFSNIKENDTVEGKIGFDPDSTIFDRILDTQPSTNYFPDREFDAETLQKFLKSVSEGPYDFVQMSQSPATERNVRRFFTLGEKLMFPNNWEEYPYRAGRVAKSVNDLRDKFLATRKQGVYVAGSDHLKAVQQFLDQPVTENFADGKIKGKSRPGRVKRAGASCAGSVTSLRQKAKNTGGERAKMYHWCANMKIGRKK